jgi:hypothetical protein
MINQLLPKKNEFYDYFGEAADLSVDASQTLLRLVQNSQDPDPISRQLKTLEHQCDEVTHRTMDLLNKTFITPLDREDIHELILKIDDVVDLINASGGRITFFQVGAPTGHAVRLAQQIVHGCQKMSAAVHGMRSPKTYDAVLRDCIAVHEVENAGDDILHEALADLFATEKDPIRVIKWKEIYEMMERATDRLEDVANVLQGVIVKMS